MTGVIFTLFFGFGRLFSSEGSPPNHNLQGSSGPGELPGSNCQGTLYGSSLQWCPTGLWGTGACYFPGAQKCENGLVCERIEAVCHPGILGSRASCYAPNFFSHECGYVDLDCREGQIQCHTANCTCCPSGSHCWGP